MNDALNSKKHYNILDGFRGVAAIMVLFYHAFESHATSPFDQIINHGYLAVDFFFLLSGFVLAYAYDSKIKILTFTKFIKRRLIRLHPMVIIGALIGGAVFYTQKCEAWDVSQIPVWMVVVATIFNMFLIPVPPQFEVRGINEMFPLNGPAWSLFFEYIGNILYVLLIRYLPKLALAILVALLGVGLATFTIINGWIGVGWALGTADFFSGLLRMLFPFTLGLLMSRFFKPINFKGSFLIGSIMLITAFSIPRIGGQDTIWMNGLYEIICIMLVFPAILYIGASGEIKSKIGNKICNFLGEISYPVYIIHYPFLYLYYAHVKNNNLSIMQSIPETALFIFGSIALAYLFLKLYDIPVRKYLSKKNKL